MVKGKERNYFLPVQSGTWHYERYVRLKPPPTWTTGLTRPDYSRQSGAECQEKNKETNVTSPSKVRSVQIMAIDGTWRRLCALKDVSESGATLVIEDSVEGLNLKEFFLLLSSTGLAYRRCEMGRMNGDQISLLRQRGKQKKLKLEDFI